ncbi:MAG: ribonuclease P protein component [Nitrospirota bacterium]|nr:MAG: ribonuclease P protein component [Nitrospirota bacterium]
MSRLKKPYEFKETFSKGKRFPGKYFILYIKESQSQSSRIGLAVSKKTGTAVARNRIKRVYREAFRKLIQGMNGSNKDERHFDLVLVGKRESAAAKMDDVLNELRAMVDKFREKR